MTAGIDHWIVCIPGHLQRRSTHGGVITLHTELARRFNGPRCRVELLPWKSDWASIAEWIARTSVGNPRIDVFAYSWGVGWGLVRLARELQINGLAINTAVTCDGVAHVGRRLWLIPRLAAFLPFWRIVIPANVRRVNVLRQQNDRRLFALRGHRIVAEDPESTMIDDAHQWDASGRVHRAMDESPTFFWRCRTVAAQSHDQATRPKGELNIEH